MCIHHRIMFGLLISAVVLNTALGTAETLQGEVVYQSDFSAGLDGWQRDDRLSEGKSGFHHENNRLIIESSGFNRLCLIRMVTGPAVVPGAEYRVFYKVHAVRVNRKPRIAESGAGVFVRLGDKPEAEQPDKVIDFNKEMMLEGDASVSGTFTFMVPDDYRGKTIALHARLYDADGRFEVEYISLERSSGVVKKMEPSLPAPDAAWRLDLVDSATSTNGWSYNRPLSDGGKYNFHQENNRMIIVCPEPATACFLRTVTGPAIVPGAEYRLSYRVHTGAMAGSPSSFDTGGNIYVWLWDKKIKSEPRRSLFFNNAMMLTGNTSVAGAFTFRVPDDYIGHITVWARVYKAQGRLEVENILLERLP